MLSRPDALSLPFEEADDVEGVGSTLDDAQLAGDGCETGNEFLDGALTIGAALCVADDVDAGTAEAAIDFVELSDVLVLGAVVPGGFEVEASERWLISEPDGPKTCAEASAHACDGLGCV